jgi:hypothetical protein
MPRRGVEQAHRGEEGARVLRGVHRARGGEQVAGGRRGAPRHAFALDPGRRQLGKNRGGLDARLAVVVVRDGDHQPGGRLERRARILVRHAADLVEDREFQRAVVRDFVTAGAARQVGADLAEVRGRRGRHRGRRAWLPGGLVVDRRQIAHRVHRRDGARGHERRGGEQEQAANRHRVSLGPPRTRVHLPRRTSGGGGGNRTRVLTCLNLRFYARSPLFDLADAITSEQVSASASPLCLTSRPRARNDRPAHRRTFRATGGRGHPERAALSSESVIVFGS